MNNRFTTPLRPIDIEKFKNKDIELYLTPKTAVPTSWHQSLAGKNILVIGGAGGKQAPLLAIKGANVTLLDISSKQLEKDKALNEKLNLGIKLIHASADQMSVIKSSSMDLIVNPLSNCFFYKLDPVWKECSRILKSSGEIIYAFNNPIAYLFDFEKAAKGDFHMLYSLPYSDIKSLSPEEKKKFLSNEGPLEFGHSLNDQISLLLKQGFVITDFFEDSWDYNDPLNKYFPQFINIRAKKL